MISSSPLGTIDRILIGHDNSGVGPAWFVDKVLLTVFIYLQLTIFNGFLACENNISLLARSGICQS